MTRIVFIFLAGLMAAACDPATSLPSSRLTTYTMPVSGDGMHMGVGGAIANDRGVYIDPRCKANEDALWAMEILEERVPRTDFRLEMVNGRADGRYIPPLAATLAAVFISAGMKVPPRKIIVRDDLAGWYLKDVRFHERCHAWLDETTGTFVFHR